MADDIVAIGGTKPGATERFEALFRAEYENLAASGTAELEVQRVFLRLWRRRWLVRDAQAAARYVRERSSQGVGTSADRGGSAPVDVERAWREFGELRSRDRRRLAVGGMAAALVALIAAAVPVVAGRLHAGQPPPFQPRAVARPPRIPPSDEGAIMARIPLGGVFGLAADGNQMWAIRGFGRYQTSYQLVEIDARTNMIVTRVRLAWQPRAVAAGSGMVWLTTPFGRHRGQLAPIDATTGKPAALLHLPTGNCLQAVYSAGWLWAGCQTVRPDSVVFMRIEPRTGLVTWRSGPVRGAGGSSGLLLMTAAPDGMWYATSTGTGGFAGPSMRAVRARPPAYSINLAVTASLGYNDGFIWAMAGDDGSVAKIDPATGRIFRIYSFTSYLSPVLAMAAGQGSLWLLDTQDFRSPAILRISMATGKPVARVGGLRLCGEQCSQVYAIGAGIWVPGQNWLTRIDPARLPR
jgi:hypothetical protein